jgi:hypothetical protein
MKKESSFKMKGFSGFGNSPMKAKASAAENLLKAVPNKKAYEKLSDIDKKGFDKAAKKAGLPTKKSPAKFDPAKHVVNFREGVAYTPKGKVKANINVDKISKKPANAAQKSFRNFKNAAKPSPRGKMATGRVGRKIAAKIGGKLLGPIGAAITARDAYKSYKDIKGGMKIGKALKKNFLGL